MADWEEGSSTICRRNKPGSSSFEFNKWQPQNINEMEGTLAIQQYLQQVIIESSENMKDLLTMPENQDESVWKFEHLR